MQWILIYKIKINIFLPEKLCIVVLAAENARRLIAILKGFAYSNTFPLN